MTGAFARLRWQLTFSHLLATAFTLLSMIAAVVFIASTVFATAQGSLGRDGSAEAHGVALAIAGLVAGGADAAQLDPVLRGLASGQLRLAAAFGPGDRRPGAAQVGLDNVEYIVVRDPTGRMLGSSDPAGTAFVPSPSSAVRVAHAPITDDHGSTLADVELALRPTPIDPAGPGGVGILRGLAIFGAASVVVLIAASVFALASSSIVAYLLARRLVARLERLGAAAEALAAGDLAQRVEDGPDDEVGQLGRRFNNMAADLERTLGELRAERDRVAGLLEQRRQLVASASHELRTPVAIVRGYLDSALGRAAALPPDLAADLTTMEHEVERLQQRIDDLFALSQAEVGRLTLRLEPTDTGAIVDRLVATTAPLAWRQRHVQVLAEIDRDAPLARADGQRVEQAVSNLLGNALRHTPPGGLVAAAVSAEPGGIRLDVRDTGSGISPADLPHVFERFFRGQGDASLDGERGAGLGLALVKELTEAMGGTVAVRSSRGEGSCFTIRLPCA